MSTAPVSNRLVDESREQLQRLAADLARKARSSVGYPEFLAEFLPGVVAATGAHGAAVWAKQSPGQWHLECPFQIEAAAEIAENAAHQELLDTIATVGSPQAIEPNLLAEPKRHANPSSGWLLIAPIKIADEVYGVVEIYQRADVRPGARTGQLTFLERMSELVGDVLSRHRLRELTSRQAWNEQLVRILREVRSMREVEPASYALVNAVRPAVGADRVSIALCGRAQARLLAISGQETFDRRANVVRLLEKFAATAAGAPLPLWLSSNLYEPPALLGPLWQAYQNESKVSSLAVLPIHVQEPGEAGASQAKPQPPTAVLILEWFEGGRWSPELSPKVGVLCDYAAFALAGPLVADGRWSGWIAARNGPAKWIARLFLAMTCLIAAASLLWMIPAPFHLHVRGTLEPATKHDVFARTDGEVAVVHVEHGDDVKRGEEVVQLRNENLAFRLQSVVGQRQQAERALESLQATRLSGVRLTAEQQSRLAGEFETHLQTRASLEIQERLLRDELAGLRVTSPLDGQVMTWNVSELLMTRPVRRGQVLLAVADPAGPWQLELHLPEDQLGTLIAAQDELGAEIPVTFVLATHPGVSFQGKLARIAQRAELDEQQRNMVLVIVEFEKSQLPPELLHAGSAVTAKLMCGEKSLGTVLFHDLAVWFQREVMFRVW